MGQNAELGLEIDTEGRCVAGASIIASSEREQAAVQEVLDRILAGEAVRRRAKELTAAFVGGVRAEASRREAQGLKRSSSKMRNRGRSVN